MRPLHDVSPYDLSQRGGEPDVMRENLCQGQDWWVGLEAGHFDTIHVCRGWVNEAAQDSVGNCCDVIAHRLYATQGRNTSVRDTSYKGRIF